MKLRELKAGDKFRGLWDLKPPHLDFTVIEHVPGHAGPASDLVRCEFQSLAGLGTMKTTLNAETKVQLLPQ